MSDALSRYFNEYAESALDRIHHGQTAIRFYKEALHRLDNGIDISDSIPEIKRVGNDVARDTANDALVDYEQRVKHAWDLPKSLADIATTRVTSYKERLENLPRYEITHTFKLEAGKFTVAITTANRNHRLEINAAGNAMAARAALHELEQYL
ncbi:MAG: hypothetical protein ACKOA0_17380, partial [Burkholderiaceae bacterium]